MLSDVAIASPYRVRKFVFPRIADGFVCVCRVSVHLLHRVARIQAYLLPAGSPDQVSSSV
jgi:hypothetical protein